MPKKTSSKDKENFLRIFRDRMYYSSIRKSCKEANIGKSTFYRWLQDPEFKKETWKIRTKRKDDLAKANKILANARSLRKTIKFLHRYGKSRGY